MLQDTAWERFSHLEVVDKLMAQQPSKTGHNSSIAFSDEVAPGIPIRRGS
jgi:hypothetical protein